MDVEGLLAVRAQGLDHRRADGQVGHEMPVHHIDVDPVGTGFVDGTNLFAQLGKVSREDGRGNDHGSTHIDPITVGPDPRKSNTAGRPVLRLPGPFDEPGDEKSVHAAPVGPQGRCQADPAGRRDGGFQAGYFGRFDGRVLE